MGWLARAYRAPWRACLVFVAPPSGEWTKNPIFGSDVCTLINITK